MLRELIFAMGSMTLANHSAIAKEIHILLGDTRAAPYSETAPGDILSTFNAAVLGQMIRTDRNFDLIPGHLASWAWDYKTSEYILKIRDGLTFHNGRKVTSLDLEFSLLRGFFSSHQSFYRTYLSNVLGVDKILPGTKFKSGLVKGVRTIDANTVGVKLSYPNPSFLLGLTGPYFSFVPIEELNADYVSWKNKPVGAGPYKVATAFYEGVTKLEAVNPSPSQAKTVQLYTTLQDRRYDISIYGSPDLHATHLSKVISELPDAVFNLSFSNIHPLSKIPAFKRFVKAAISKTELVKGIEGFSPAEELLPRHLWGRADLRPSTDIEEAKRLVDGPLSDLKKTGIRLSVFSGPKLSTQKAALVQALQKQFEAVGVKLQYETSLNKFASKEEAARCNLFLSGMISDYIDPLVMFASLTKRGADPYARSVIDEKLEQLYEESAKNAQKEDRIKSLRKLSEYVDEKIYVIPLAEEHVVTYFDPNSIATLGEQSQPLTLFIDKVAVK
jgi:peptide/nickel transport system substrate-binding protein